MDETVPAPAFMDDADFGMKPKRIMTQPEWAVQRGVMRFCRRAIACEFEFASHDRGRPRSEMEHIGEAARGVRHGWPDVELALAGSRTFRCELKAPGVNIERKERAIPAYQATIYTRPSDHLGEQRLRLRYHGVVAGRAASG